VNFTAIWVPGGGFTLSVAEAEPPKFPVIETFVAAVTAVVVTVKVAEVDPAATVTLDGTCAVAGVALVKVTMAPPLAAAAVNVTVPVEDDPPVTLEGLSVTEDNIGVELDELPEPPPQAHIQTANPTRDRHATTFFRVGTVLSPAFTKSHNILPSGQPLSYEPQVDCVTKVTPGQAWPRLRASRLPCKLCERSALSLQWRYDGLIDYCWT
jgi:hypothetical protein